MAEITIRASAVVDAPAATVYGVLADYHEGHPGILPRPPFGELVMESGGTGAGTRFRVTTRQGLGMITYRMAVTEPEPGHLLVERDQDSDLVSTFRVDPVSGGRSHVTIATRYTRRGIKGLLERMLLPTLAAPIYRKEIANLERVARERSGAAPG